MNTTETPQEGTTAAAPAVESTATEMALTPQQIATNHYTEVKAQIARYNDDYMGLKIEGPEDKKGAELVKKAKNVVVKTRTNSGRINDQANAPLKAQIKANDAALADALAGLLPIEKHLKDEEATYLAATKAAEKERLDKLRERMEDRINDLRELGFVFNRMMQSYWVNYNGQDVMVGMDDLEKWNETDFTNFYDETSVLYQANETRKQQEADEAKRQQDLIEQQRQQLQEERKQLEQEKATARQNQVVTSKPESQPVQIDRVETPPVQIDQVPPVTPAAAPALDLANGPSDAEGALLHIEEQREQQQEPQPEPVVETVPVAAVEPAAIDVDDHTDKQKFLALADQIAALEIPICDTFEGGLLVDVVADHVAALITLIRNQANAL